MAITNFVYEMLLEKVKLGLSSLDDQSDDILLMKIKAGVNAMKLQGVDEENILSDYGIECLTLFVSDNLYVGGKVEISPAFLHHISLLYSNSETDDPCPPKPCNCGFTEAPIDDEGYLRKNAGWTKHTSINTDGVTEQWVHDNALTSGKAGTYTLDATTLSGKTVQQWLDANVNDRYFCDALTINIVTASSQEIYIHDLFSDLTTINISAKMGSRVFFHRTFGTIIVNAGTPVLCERVIAENVAQIRFNGTTQILDDAGASFFVNAQNIVFDNGSDYTFGENKKLEIRDNSSITILGAVKCGELKNLSSTINIGGTGDLQYITYSTDSTGIIIDNRSNRPLETYSRVEHTHNGGGDGVEEAPDDGWEYTRGDKTWNKSHIDAGKSWIPLPTELLDIRCCAISDMGVVAMIGAVQQDEITPPKKLIIGEIIPHNVIDEIDNYSWMDMTYAPSYSWTEGYFYAVAMTGGNNCLIAINCNTYEIKTGLINLIPQKTLWGIHFANDWQLAIGTILAVGEGGIILRASAANAMVSGTWTPIASGTTETLFDVNFGNHVWVIVGDNGTILKRKTGETNFTQYKVSANLRKICYCSTTKEFIAIGKNQQGNAVFAIGKNDGTQWTIETAPTGDWMDIERTGNMTVLVGSDGRILTSRSRTNWVERVNPSNMPLTCITSLTMQTLDNHMTAFVAGGKGIGTGSAFLSMKQTADTELFI